MLDTPILFLIFNRLDTTKRVFDEIKKAQPTKLFIAADGPRANRPEEYRTCMQLRDMIDDNIDWPCEIHRLYREDNLGCGKAVSSAISWFFDNVEKGIILEDDILPDYTFFSYCQDMLNLYVDDEEVMHISGCNLQCGIKRGNTDYYFSKYPGIWGWATWRRAWNKYSFSFFDDSNETINIVLNNRLSNINDINHFSEAMIKTKERHIDTWDYQWVYTIFKSGGVCIIPQRNLINNIGFNSQGTHTIDAPYWYRYLTNGSVDTKGIRNNIIINAKADNFTMDLTSNRRSSEIVYIKALYKLKSFLFKK